MGYEQQDGSMSRRGFLVAAGTLASAALVAGTACAPQDAGSQGGGEGSVATAGLPDVWDFSCDILVIGGGGGGTVAAAKASELGAEVILLEKADALGGDTALSSQAAQGLWQERMDAGDSIDLYIEDMKESHWATEKGQMGVELPADFPLTRAWLENCSAMYNWAEEHGMAWVDVTTEHEAWYPQPQWDTKTTRQWAPGGGSLMAILAPYADEVGVDVRTGTSALRLITDGEGRVVGAYAFDADDELIAIKARKAVILACGGFNANRGMMSRYLPVQGTGFCGGCDGNTGDGHRMAKAIGAKLVDMRLGTHWMVYDDVSSTTMYNGAVMAYGGNAALTDAADYPFILVNMDGERFMAETMGYKWVGYETNAQPYHLNHIVFDSGEASTAWFEKAAARDGGPEALRVYREASLDDLAAAMQVPVASLTATVERYNGFVESGKDEDFDRSMRKVAKLEVAPFCAIRMRPRHYTTYGGVSIDSTSRVLDEAG
ncbi:MAG: FAD-dependent oxidoreductase, partial [Coriobacteriales bacterium]|nr:FAD-dependent oxidoreductase [Coriobacteriales bacterium]